MLKSSVVVRAEHGLHTRPAALIVKAARAFDSNISFGVGDKSVNAKSLFKLQTLGMVKGATVVISAEGADEVAAIAELTALVEHIES